ncbi:ornithine decarboxylase [Solanum dulcamara]|uniref:ornithine decarboxylase n=1 Tax=Solanum dulcamara TaxID=45834 RepID=UPI002485F58A|nr:ornithine decarboxylase [Solanum dulcamara]
MAGQTVIVSGLNPAAILQSTIGGAPAENGHARKVVPLSRDALQDFMVSIITQKLQDEKQPFYVLDLGEVVSLMDQWNTALPNIRPFYAVKCNPEPSFLSMLSAMGSNFDCASRAEIEYVLSLGISPDRIVFANPCKPESDIIFAEKVGVNLTTYDSEEEVYKIRKHHPKCEVLLRIKPMNDGNARCPMGPKYGALPEEIEPLLRTAQAARLTVSGVSFHIGSGDADSNAYVGAIAAAKQVFETANQLGMSKMTVLDIGGGFTSGHQFTIAAPAVKSALEQHFLNFPELTIIAEPGRFFAETAFTLATTVIGKRVRGELKEYWINDGLYGSMNCVLYDHAAVTATPLACMSNRNNLNCGGSKTFPSTVFGPTCDALDTVLRDYQLPELQVNDWLVFPNMGAYTKAAGSNFNGFNTSAIVTHLAYAYPS